MFISASKYNVSFLCLHWADSVEVQLLLAIRITRGQWLCLKWLQNRNTGVWKIWSVWHHTDTKTEQVRMGIRAVFGYFEKTADFLNKHPLVSAALQPCLHNPQPYLLLYFSWSFGCLYLWFYFIFKLTFHFYFLHFYTVTVTLYSHFIPAFLC